MNKNKKMKDLIMKPEQRTIIKEANEGEEDDYKPSFDYGFGKLKINYKGSEITPNEQALINKEKELKHKMSELNNNMNR